MQFSQVPGRLVLPFAVNGNKNTIPTTQASPDGSASLDLGFPPETSLPDTSGGIGPDRLDFNGVLFALSAIARWMNAGSGFPYSPSFATDSNVGGYPKGAILPSSDGRSWWFNGTDNNTSDPDTLGVGWTTFVSPGVTDIVMTSSNKTLTAGEARMPIIRITGALTANLQLNMPGFFQNWLIVNNCTGNFYITVKTSAGSGVNVQAGSTQYVYGDGTNIGAYNGNAQVTWKVGNASTVSEAVNLGQFGSSLVSSGYQRLPSGLIVQWGVTGTISAGSSSSVSLPLTFPNSGFIAVASPSVGSNTTTAAPGGTSISTSTITVYNMNASDPYAFFWIAIGY